MSLITVIIILGLYNVQYAYYAGASVNHRVCNGYAQPSNLNVFWAWVNFSINSLIPFVTLISLNTAIIYKVHVRKKYFKKQSRQEQYISNPLPAISHSCLESVNSSRSNALSKPKEENKSTNNNENQMLRTLLMVSFTLLVLTMPFYVRNIVYTFYDKNASLKTFILQNFLWHVSSKIFCLNNAVNFFLYILGGKKFREDVKNLFSCFNHVRVTKGEIDGST